MKRTFLTGVACTLFLLLMPACGGDSSDGNDDIPSQTATFQASVSGSLDGDVMGTAFGGGPNDGTGWGLVLGVVPGKAGGLDGSITIVRNEGDRPSNGTYSILGAQSEPAQDFYAVAIIGGGFYSSTSGNFVVTSSNNSNVRGTFGFSATNGTDTITIEGGFNATNYTYFPN